MADKDAQAKSAAAQARSRQTRRGHQGKARDAVARDVIPQAGSGHPQAGPPAGGDTLDRIARALERMAPRPDPGPPEAWSEAWVWNGEEGRLRPVEAVSRIPLALLHGIDRVRDALLANTERFARGLPANNALLWGARGMGKSSLVKAVHAEVNGPEGKRLALVEVHREDVESLPQLLRALRASPWRFLLFCDDLSFDADDASYKSLKTILDGGIEGRPRNTLFYATSNRRHMMPRTMIENERSTAIAPSEAVEEKVSASDRFGLWLGFHGCSQDDYLAMVRGYAAHFGLEDKDGEIERGALEWSVTRGARSGRVAWQYIQDLAGRLGVALD